MNEFQQVNKDMRIYLVGNKSDLDTFRQVSQEDIQLFMKENKCKYFEVSAKSGQNVVKVFEEIAEDSKNVVEKGEE